MIVLSGYIEDRDRHLILDFFTSKGLMDLNNINSKYDNFLETLRYNLRKYIYTKEENELIDEYPKELFWRVGINICKLPDKYIPKADKSVGTVYTQNEKIFIPGNYHFPEAVESLRKYSYGNWNLRNSNRYLELDSVIVSFPEDVKNEIYESYSMYLQFYFNKLTEFGSKLLNEYGIVSSRLDFKGDIDIFLDDIFSYKWQDVKYKYPELYKEILDYYEKNIINNLSYLDKSLLGEGDIKERIGNLKRQLLC